MPGFPSLGDEVDANELSWSDESGEEEEVQEVAYIPLTVDEEVRSWVAGVYQ